MLASHRLGKRLLYGSAASESAATDEKDCGEHQSQDDPANPGKSHESLGGVAVRERIALVSAAEASASSVGQSSGTGHPKDPCQEQGDSVTGDRGDDTADAEEEECGVGDSDNEAPPSGKDKETSSVVDTARGWVVVRVVVINKCRSNDGHNEGDKGEQTKGNWVSSSDGGRSVNHSW